MNHPRQQEDREEPDQAVDPGGPRPGAEDLHIRRNQQARERPEEADSQAVGGEPWQKPGVSHHTRRTRRRTDEVVQLERTPMQRGCGIQQHHTMDDVVLEEGGVHRRQCEQGGAEKRKRQRAPGQERAHKRQTVRSHWPLKPIRSTERLT